MVIIGYSMDLLVDNAFLIVCEENLIVYLQLHYLTYYNERIWLPQILTKALLSSTMFVISHWHFISDSNVNNQSGLTFSMNFVDSLKSHQSNSFVNS